MLPRPKWKRTVDVIPQGPGPTRITHVVRFYEGALEVSVDGEGRYVGAAIRDDLAADEPLLLPGSTAADVTQRIQLQPNPVYLLFDDGGRLRGVHVTGELRVKRP